MDLKKYVLSIILAAIISGILVNLANSKSAQGTLIKLLAGTFVALTVIAPLGNFRLHDLTSYFDELNLGAGDAVAIGEQSYSEALRASIIDNTQAYILEKASSLGASVTAEICLSDTDPPMPATVEVTGDISPYAKIQLKQIIASDLGIPEEAQTWK